MKPYMKKFYLEYNSSDIKPKGKMSKAIQSSFRSKARKEIKSEIDDIEAYYDYDQPDDDYYEAYSWCYQLIWTMEILYCSHTYEIQFDAENAKTMFDKHRRQDDKWILRYIVK